MAQSQSVAKLTIQLEGEVNRLKSDMAAMQAVVQSHMGAINDAAGAASENIKKVGEAGRSVGRVKAVDEMVDQMDHLNFSTVGARRELLVLAHEAANGNWKRFAGSLMVLGERVDAMSLIFSKAGLIMGATAAAIGGFIVAAAMGAHEAEQLSRSLTLTGNMAGITAGSFGDLAKHIADSNRATIGTSREALQAVISTGAFTRNELDAVTSAVIQHSKMNGEEAAKVVADYAKMRDGVAKWAEEHNKSMHYMSAATFDRIKALEDAGKTEQALLLNLETLNSQFAEQSQKKLGIIERSWLAIKQAISGTWDAMKAIGRPETTDDKIERLLTQRRNAARPIDQQGTNASAWSKANEQQLSDLRELKRFEEAQANRQSAIDVAQEKAIRASVSLDQMLTSLDKNYAKAKEIRKLNKDFEDTLLGNPNSDKLKGVKATLGADGSYGFSGGLYDRAIREINERYRDKRGDHLAFADMEKQLKPLQDAIRQEKDTLSQRDKFLSLYYKNGQISADQFYTGQTNALSEHVEKVTALYNKEIATVQAFAAKSGDAAKKIDAAKRVQELVDERERTISADKARMLEIDVEKTKTTDEYRLALQKLNDELAKMEGRLGSGGLGEFDRTHDALKKRMQAEGDAGGLDTLDRLRNLTSIQGQMNDLKLQSQKITENLKTTEDSYRLAVETGQMNELQGMLAIGSARQQAASDLGKLADQITELAMQSNGNVEMLKFAQQFDDQVKRVQISANTLGQKFEDVFTNGLSKALLEITDRTKTWQQAVLGFATTIEQTITRFVTDSLIKQLMGSLTSGAGGDSSGSGLIGMIAGLFGGAMADGGETSPGKFYRVNENGPELYTVANRTYLMSGNQSGHVTPISAGSMSGGRSTVMHMNINVPPGTTRQTAQQQAAEIMRHAQIASMRNT